MFVLLVEFFSLFWGFFPTHTSQKYSGFILSHIGPALESTNKEIIPKANLNYHLKKSRQMISKPTNTCLVKKKKILGVWLPKVYWTSDIPFSFPASSQNCNLTGSQQLDRLHNPMTKCQWIINLVHLLLACQYVNFKTKVNMENLAISIVETRKEVSWLGTALSFLWSSTLNTSLSDLEKASTVTIKESVRSWR